MYFLSCQLSGESRTDFVIIISCKGEEGKRQAAGLFHEVKAIDQIKMKTADSIDT